ncbi:MAG: hypothetical protein SOY04_14090 [Clostridium celatum]|nr:hypothetical protein [Clostridium celatum]
MKEDNEYKKVKKILWASLFFIGLFLLSYYKHYAFLILWLGIFIFLILPKIKNK